MWSEALILNNGSWSWLFRLGSLAEGLQCFGPRSRCLAINCGTRPRREQHGRPDLSNKSYGGLASASLWQWILRPGDSLSQRRRRHGTAYKDGPHAWDFANHVVADRTCACAAYRRTPVSRDPLWGISQKFWAHGCGHIDDPHIHAAPHD